MAIFSIKFQELTLREKRTFGIHTAHMILEGIIDGALLLSEFILIKSLLGSNFQISYLFQFAVIPMVFSVVINEFIKRTKNIKKLLRIIATITRLPLIALLFFPSSMQEIASNSAYASIYIIVFFFYYMYKPVILPTINLFLRANYRSKNFGRLYSYSTSIKKIIVLATTFSFGLLLDYNNYAFTYVYPILAILGIISIYLLTFIEFDSSKITKNTKGLFASIKASINELINIVKTNKPYRDFEIGFLLYGFAWMGTTAVITIFMEKQLNLSYSSVAFYKNSYNLIAILLLPAFGKLIGKIDPRKFAIITFSMLLLHLLFVPLTQLFPIQYTHWGIQLYLMLFLSFIFNGIFTASMALLWGIGSSYFCKDEDAGSYQSIHITMVGFRGMFAPIVGIVFFQQFGYTVTFGIGITSLLIAIILMRISQNRHKM